MVSAINATLPANGVLAQKSDLRANLAAAKAEIEALQGQDVNLLAALGLSAADVLFAVIAGNNLPDVPASFQTIMQSLDAQIDVAKAAAGGGPITLADITDILTPTDAQRLAFQSPVEIASEGADFNFDENIHGGLFVPLDTSVNTVQVTMPAAGTLAREDGYVCSFSPISSAFAASITGPADSLRLQNNFFGLTETQTTAFLGLSLASSFRTVVDVFKDGSIYILRGPTRLLTGEDISFNAPGSIPGDALAALGLLAATFPNLLDLGGTKQAGGNRVLIEAIAGNHTFVQANSGKTLEHTGGAAATWNVPALLAGTLVEIDNAIGGAITLNDTGAQTVLGGTTLASGAAGAVKWLNGSRVRFIGTS